MEPWQRKVIRDNLTYLIHNISCNTFLLAKLAERSVLGRCDRENLELLHLTPTDKTHRLLQVLQTKLNGFDILIATLCDPAIQQYAPAIRLFEGRHAYYLEQGQQQPPVAYLDLEDAQRIPPNIISAHILPRDFPVPVPTLPYENWHAQVNAEDLLTIVDSIDCSETLLVKLVEKGGLTNRERIGLEQILINDRCHRLINILRYKRSGFDILIATLCDHELRQYEAAQCVLERRYEYFMEREQEQPPIRFIDEEFVRTLPAAAFPALNLLPPVAALLRGYIN